MTNQKYVSIAEAARRLGIARGTVYSWIKNGALETITHAANGRTLVSVASIETITDQQK